MQVNLAPMVLEGFGGKDTLNPLDSKGYRNNLMRGQRWNRHPAIDGRICLMRSAELSRLNTGKMFFVDDPGSVADTDCFSAHGNAKGFDLGDKGINVFPRHPCVVEQDASLVAIGHFAVSNSPCRIVQRIVPRNHGGQAGENDVIERLNISALVGTLDLHLLSDWI